MAEDNILYTLEEGIAVITLNRTEKMNAVSDDMLGDFTNLVNEIIIDDAVRGVILTGNGRAFCAGTDVGQGIARDHAEAGRERAKRIKKVDLPDSVLPGMWQLTRIPKPTIAAVNGAAVGMGAEWTIQCDIRIASEKARFGWVFPLRGIVPDTGAGPYLLPYVVGLSKALELMYSGEIIDAEEAQRIGLVTKVVPPDELLSASMEMAARITYGAPLSIKAIKEITYGSLEWSLDVFGAEKTSRFQSTSDSEDAKEGVASFLEKRPPAWKGR
jgi:enoyl-CoA hydratase|tara:strand:+ start:2246 stop:3058 length:813 start_codon:yes stop_codon:yes gene_type:complete